MSTNDRPPPHRTSRLDGVLRLAAVLLVLCGLAWGASEHDAVVSSAVGVAPPADDAPRDTTWTDVQRSVDDDRELAAQVPAAPGAGSPAPDVAASAPVTTGGCGTGCHGPPTLRGPPGT